MSLSTREKKNITKRVIDDIALLTLYNVTKLEQSNLDNWIKEFKELDTEEIHEVIEFIFYRHCVDIDNAANECHDYIKIPGLGSLRLNKARHNILKYIRDNGEIPDKVVKDIIDEYVANKKLINSDAIINTKITLNEKRYNE